MEIASAEGRLSEKIDRIEKVEDKSEAENLKEKRCKDYVKKYAESFLELHPEKKLGFLLPLNEYKIPKFVCTTLKPTLLPYSEVYEMEKLVDFIAHFLDFEPLANLEEYPLYYPSPALVLEWKVGDAFDFAQVLVSFLLGAGYDAYVVIGKAPLWICRKDLSYLKAPAVFDTYEEEDTAKEVKVPKGQRHYVHSWVLVKTKKENLYIEATSGQIYSINDAPYSEIEAMWNHVNYHINLQPTNLDLNSLHWESLFTKTENVESIEMPKSWQSMLLHIPRNDFDLKYPPNGQRTLYYHRSKLELFSRHVQGLVSRLTLYFDESRLDLIRIIEHFAYRQDKLKMRIREMRKETEVFENGQSFGLKRLVQTATERDFYFQARQDGLISRHDTIGSKIIERFIDRPDGLTYRSVAVKKSTNNAPQFTLPDINASEFVVLKMTQKYAKAKSNLAKRTFFVQVGKIKTLYHYSPLQISRSAQLHLKHQDAHAPEALAAERDCLTEIRRSQLEILDLLKMRRREEFKVALFTKTPPSIDAAFSVNSSISIPKHSIAGSIQKEQEVDSEAKEDFDYLSPFLRNVTDIANITYAQAQAARDACLMSQRERLIERANIIMARLNEENAKLAKRQAMFQRQRDNDAATEEEFERFCSEVMFRIQILEQRLASHEESAVRKFQDLDDRLYADPRLSVLR